MDYHIYNTARKRVREKRRFYTHFASWMVMSAFFILLNLFTSDYFWAIFPILGWGIGLAFHGIKVFTLSYGDEWEDREIQKEMEKLKRKEKWRFHQDGTELKEELNLKSYKELRKEWDESDFV